MEKTIEQKCYDFENRFNNGLISWDISKYIPKRLYDAGAIQHAFIDSDGYWIWLEDGWYSYDAAEDCGQVHEYTIKDLKAAIKQIRYTGVMRDGKKIHSNT